MKENSDLKGFYFNSATGERKNIGINDVHNDISMPSQSASIDQKALYVYLKDMQKNGQKISEVTLDNGNILTIAIDPRAKEGFRTFENGEEIRPDKAAKKFYDKLVKDASRDKALQNVIKDEKDFEQKIEKEFNEVTTDIKLKKEGIEPPERKSMDFVQAFNEIMGGTTR